MDTPAAFETIVVNEFGPPSVMGVATGAEAAPAADQLVVDVFAAGINPVETYIRSGEYARKPALPFTPGRDGAGVVAAVGADVTAFRPGDRVVIALTAGMGTYSQRLVCREADLHPLPERLSFEQGAAIGTPYLTAYRALFDRAALRPGDRVLVHGASGAVGLAAVQLARRAGCHVIGTAGTEEGMQLVMQHGAQEALSHRAEGYLEGLKAAAAAGQGQGVDVVVEMLANVNLDSDLDVCNAEGRVAIVGSRGTLEINPRKIMARELDVRGVMAGRVKPGESGPFWALMSQGMADGTLSPVVGPIFEGLAAAPAAHEEVLAHSNGSSGKVVLRTRQV